MVERPVVHGPIGLFGKIPAQGDFFRVNVADPSGQALVAWLHEAIEPVFRAKLPLPAAPVRFLFRAQGARSAIVGVFAASRDRVGRAFPLCAIVPASGDALGSGFPAVPAAYRAFCDAAASLLQEAASLDAGGLADRARALPLPGGEALGVAVESARRAAAAEPSRELVSRLFGGLPEGAVAYALSTIVAATRPLRGKEPARAAVALDCPVERDVDRWAWLEIARRALGWPAPPTFFWTEDASPRLLVSLGSPAAALLASLSDRARAERSVWPLRATQAAAIDAARRGAPPVIEAAASRGEGSVEALVSAIA